MTERTFPSLHVLTPATQTVDDLRVVDAVLGAGAPAIQVRRKGGTDREHLEVCRVVAARAHAAGAWCIVNDRVDLALAAGADGVHLGADDLPVAEARALAGDRLVIGGTARDPGMARALVAAGADYLGVGPTFATRTKDGLPDPLGPARVAAVADAVEVPVVAIAGIDVEGVASFAGTRVAGVAVVGAVVDAADPAAATRDLLAAIASAGLDRGSP